jgi:hypothetical protein
MREPRDRRKHATLRVIKTARDEQSINEGARAGFFPLVKPVTPSPEIRSKFAVRQNRVTGEIEVLGDFRSQMGSWVPKDTEMVIDFRFHYPYRFPAPFAAYLLPPDLQVGERVLLEDLIEDHVGARWNQGDVYRLERCEAIWNGRDFEIEYDPEETPAFFMG